MQELVALSDKLKTLNRDLREYAEQIIEANAEKIEELNLQQLYDGKDADGNDITPEYAESTKRIKRKKGQPTNRVTLNDKGDFYQGIKLKKVQNIYELVGTDSKSKILEAKYGDRIIDLSEESKGVLVNEILLPAMEEKIKQIFTI